MPPAPDRFSTTTGCFSPVPAFCATMRATMSVPPPGAYGTTRRIGLLGSAWPSAAWAKQAHSSNAAATRTAFLRDRPARVSSLGRERRAAPGDAAEHRPAREPAAARRVEVIDAADDFPGREQARDALVIGVLHLPFGVD